jgi:hypothetical protein
VRFRNSYPSQSAHQKGIPPGRPPPFPDMFAAASLHCTARSRSFQPPLRSPVEVVPPRSNYALTSRGHSESAERRTSRPAGRALSANIKLT